jgi:hypothetical protein
VQEGVLNIAFRHRRRRKAAADRPGICAVLSPSRRPDLAAQYGNVSGNGRYHPTAAGLNQGGMKFFGEPALVLSDFLRTDRDGRHHHVCSRTS